MNNPTKRCTKCGEAKPLIEFYLRDRAKPEGLRRSSCKACGILERKQRRHHGLSIQNQIIRHSAGSTAQLSPEAEAAIYTDKPVDPVLLANYKKRQARQRATERRRARDLAKDPSFRLAGLRRVSGGTL